MVRKKTPFTSHATLSKVVNRLIFTFEKNTLQRVNQTSKLTRAILFPTTVNPYRIFAL